ncbi:hypothetical protein A7A78_14325 [Aequorivita soesokkakensis]|jgi:hypothetical protein|uniref:Uncharacterized protein n=1 Tax=Aequorivita soesokkakensis TaxID=1385699 RepID=A0A1A9LBK8_9FLAO|nr:hypothetical protein [Aequorivita soesokkakensis]OAD90739.1 hypothetical protein A7A78_14325 [Aequorivita soesokkakensis]
MKNDNKKKKEKLQILRRMRNLGWALTAMGGGVIGLPGPGLLERLAVYTIVVGTIVSVGSQALINEMEGRDGDFGSSGGGAAWTIYKNEG